MIRIFDKEMTEINLVDYRLQGLSFRPSALSPNHYTDSVSGKPGINRNGSEHGPRRCEAEFFIEAINFYTHSLFVSELFELFDPSRLLYIVQEEQLGKRWPVVVSAEWTPERINPFVSTFTVPFETYELPYAESINTSLTPQTFDQEWWQLGMGLIAEDTPYTFNTSSFRVYNPGNVTINPFYCDMEIILNVACNSYVEVQNTTTGDLWRYNGSLTTDDTVRLGFKAKKNNLSIYRSTNRQVITLKPGWNDIKINGTTSIQNVQFAFRFYYKG